MKEGFSNLLRRGWVAACLIVGCSLTLHGQNTEDAPAFIPSDSLFTAPPLIMPEEDSLAVVMMTDSVRTKGKRDWNTWRPNPRRALWLSIVLPGAGQIYNRKYWKLPIFYGGFIGCVYAITWNNQMYHDYSQAYLDIMDDDPNTQSYNSFLHLGTKVTESNKKRYQDLFQKRKDRFRRYRDLSCFILVGVYALSVIDAYVDASLSEFDISDDLSLRVSPAVFGDHTQRNPMKAGGLGIGCSLTF